LKWIRQQPSLVTESPPPNDAHHLWGTGKAGKNNDLMSVSMTRILHSEIHSIGHQTFEKKYNIDLFAEAFGLLCRYISELKECAKEGEWRHKYL
jgi:hypothetical protein